MAKTVRVPFNRFDLTKLIDLMGITDGVEIGVSHGYFSHYLLKHSSLNHLMSVDSWSRKFSRTMEDAVNILSEFGERSTVVRAASMKAVADVEEGTKFGFIYIDGNHKREYVREDIAAWLPLLKRPGILAGHDYVEANGCGVMEAVQEAADKLDTTIYLTKEPRLASWFVMFGDEQMDSGLRKECLSAIREADLSATVGVIMLAKVVLKLVDHIDSLDSEDERLRDGRG